MSSEQVYGVTPPISVTLPTDAEKRASDALISELRQQKTFESPSDTQKRHTVLESLQDICNEFVRTVAKTREPKNDVLIRNARGKIFTYGSFRLGVFGPGSDIDTLIVAPRYVMRDDYFEHFPGLLLAMTPKDAITDLTVVKDAFVPIIKFEYSGISIDLIFSRVIQKQLPPDLDLRDSGLLRGLDEPELRSLNGTRVTDEILALVPEQSTFKLALRAIKLWAQRRAVYANIMGFPGGVAWAMLVARVCQLYPKAATSTIVNKFFLVIGQWRWPQPVLLKPIESGALPVRVWNPKIHKGDGFHLMPVITPAYPSMCSTFNITRSSMTIIQQELRRGLRISEDIMMGKQPWSALFVKHTFFTRDFKFYMTVTSAGKTKEAHKIWSGYVESKVRMLVQRLEQHPSIELARPFNKGFDRQHRCKTDDEIALVQEGNLNFVVPKGSTPELGSATKTTDPINGEEVPDVADVYTSTHYIGVQLVESKCKSSEVVILFMQEVRGKERFLRFKMTTADSPRETKALDLSYQVDDFKALCMQWDKYKNELQSLVSLGVQHVKSSLLPDDLFEDGEIKPRKSGGVKNSRNETGTPNPPSAVHGKKRGPPEDQTASAKRQHASVAAAG